MGAAFQPDAVSRNGHRRSFAVVGGGFGGVAAAVMLRRAGYDDVTVFERGERLGGVWNHNTYPGAACDVPSHLYEFSFEPNPRWSRRYAPQAEIQAYVEDVARRHGVLEEVRTEHRGDARRWVEERSRWLLETSAGRAEADVLITACGQLSVPKMPPIPGLESFAGPAFHTSQWRHDVELAGKRVAVMGTGCSAIQTVPAIQPLVSGSSTSTSARPAGRCRRWTSPTPSAPSGCSSASRALQRLDRLAIFAFMELGALGDDAAIASLLAPFRAIGAPPDRARRSRTPSCAPR